MQSPAITKPLVLLSLSIFLERIAFYGARALLFYYLFYVARMQPDDATKTYTLFFTCIFLGKIPGGLIADLFGRKRTMLIGGVLQTAGLLLFALEAEDLFWQSFAVFVIGNSLYTPAVFGQLGLTWQRRPEKRDAGFTFNYLLLNVGAFLGAFAAPLSGMKFFSTGFLLAAAIMAVSTLLCFFLSAKEPDDAANENAERKPLLRLVFLAIICLVFWFFVQFGQIALQGFISQNSVTNQTFNLVQTCVVIGASLTLAICWWFLRLSPVIKMTAGAMTVAAAFLVCYLLLDITNKDFPMLIVTAVLIGLGETLISPIITSFLVEIATRKYLSTWSGIFSGIFYMSMLLSDYSIYFPNRVSDLLAAIGLLGLAVLIYVTMKEKRQNNAELLDSRLDE